MGPMTTRFHSAAAALAAALLAGCAHVGPVVAPVRQALEAPPHPLQAVVVTSAGWSSPRATLRRYERRTADDPWTAVGQPVPVNVGRNGMAWGTGRHVIPSGSATRKAEGDGRAPAGVFPLQYAFGYAPTEEMGWVRLPYRQSVESSQCVDDVRSRHYNTVLDVRNAAVDWMSYERMRRPDALYELGVFVGHNADPPVAGRGSCIFLHVWESPEVATSGCTAMERFRLEELLRWLTPAGAPVLVQMPQAEYDRLRTPWDLP
jgi:D-alanyl-D-alanine dipeptidase